MVADIRRRHHPEFHRPADRAEHLQLFIAAGRSDRLYLQGSEWEVGHLGRRWKPLNTYSLRGQERHRSTTWVIWFFGALGRAGGLVRVELRSPGLEEVQEDPDGCPAADEASTQPPARLQLLCLRAAGLRFVQIFVNIRRGDAPLVSCVKYPSNIKILTS